MNGIRALHPRTFCSLIFSIAILIGNAQGAAAKIPKAVQDDAFFEFGNVNLDKINLGKFLMFDKILSGNQNIACATCHHPFAATGDGLSLPIGNGGSGFGVARVPGPIDTGIRVRIPRNAPPLFNLGAKEFTFMFDDGRVHADSTKPSGFDTPAGNQLPTGLDNPLAAQAMFPVQDVAEMVGLPGTNPVADQASAGNLAGPGGAWDLLAARLRAIPAYVQLFELAYSGEITSGDQITYVHAANAIAAFEAHVWRMTNSPFDRYLKHDRGAMTSDAVKGMRLFYGKANCASCHSGIFQTDHKFHSIGMPQIGPGKGDGADGHDDFGRERVTLDTADRYKFRTMPLRNIAITGPWGHDGAFNTLEGIVRHHLDSVKSMSTYDPTQLVLPSRPDLDAQDLIVFHDPTRSGPITASSEIKAAVKGKVLTDKDIANLLEFLQALTDPNSLDLRSNAPLSVPSGLPLSD